MITYGENYGCGKIGEGLTHKAGMEQPLHYWVPSIAPSGMTFLTCEHPNPARGPGVLKETRGYASAVGKSPYDLHKFALKRRMAAPT